MSVSYRECFLNDVVDRPIGHRTGAPLGLCARQRALQACLFILSPSTRPIGEKPGSRGQGGAPHRLNDLDSVALICWACPGRWWRDGQAHLSHGAPCVGRLGAHPGAGAPPPEAIEDHGSGGPEVISSGRHPHANTVLHGGRFCRRVERKEPPPSGGSGVGACLPDRGDDPPVSLISARGFGGAGGSVPPWRRPAEE